MLGVLFHYCGAESSHQSKLIMEGWPGTYWLDQLDRMDTPLDYALQIPADQRRASQLQREMLDFAAYARSQPDVQFAAHQEYLALAWRRTQVSLALHRAQLWIDSQQPK